MKVLSLFVILFITASQCSTFGSLSTTLLRAQTHIIWTPNPFSFNTNDFPSKIINTNDNDYALTTAELSGSTNVYFSSNFGFSFLHSNISVTNIGVTIGTGTDNSGTCYFNANTQNNYHR